MCTYRPACFIRATGAAGLVGLATGIALLLVGPSLRAQMLTLHKASFIVWLPFTGLHVLGHLPALAQSLRPPSVGGGEGLASSAGFMGRSMALVAGLLVGLIVAIALIPAFAPWTAHTALLHSDH